MSNNNNDKTEIVKDKEYYNKLIGALNLIKSECEGRVGDNCCEDCPMGDIYGDCTLYNTYPHTWEVISEPIIRIVK
jgi:hypothetical protein